jgi:hypothetical protein
VIATLLPRWMPCCKLSSAFPGYYHFGQGECMRLNTDGLIAIFAMIGMVSVALMRGGYYILVVAVIIIAYGGAVLVSTSMPRRDQLQSRGELVSLHVAFLLTLSSFFVALPGEPFVFWAVAPLVLLLSFAIFNHVFAYKHQVLNLWHLIDFLPPVLLITIAITKEWIPLWYPAAGLTLYSLLLLPQAPKAIPDQKLIGTYLALLLVSLGLLVDTSGVPIPDWAADPSRSGAIPFLVQASIFLGCGVVGLVLPFLLLKEK